MGEQRPEWRPINDAFREMLSRQVPTATAGDAAAELQDLLHRGAVPLRCDGGKALPLAFVKTLLVVPHCDALGQWTATIEPPGTSWEPVDQPWSVHIFEVQWANLESLWPTAPPDEAVGAASVLDQDQPYALPPPGAPIERHTIIDAIVDHDLRQIYPEGVPHGTSPGTLQVQCEPFWDAACAAHAVKFTLPTWPTFNRYVKGRQRRQQDR
jgi:hypothetical protein